PVEIVQPFGNGMRPLAADYRDACLGVETDASVDLVIGVAFDPSDGGIDDRHGAPLPVAFHPRLQAMFPSPDPPAGAVYTRRFPRISPARFAMHERYDASAIEKAAQAHWQSIEAYRAVENDPRFPNGKFYACSMLPYPSGRLHM